MFIAAALVLSACGGGTDSPSSSAASGYQSPIDHFISAARANPDVSSIKAPDAAEMARLASEVKSLKDGNGALVSKSASGTEKAIINGWNFHYPDFCITSRFDGILYLTMYMKDGFYIVTSDPSSIAGLSPACVAAPVVGVYVTGVSGSYLIWSYFLVAHI
jgi:hypothetical protein